MRLNVVSHDEEVLCVECVEDLTLLEVPDSDQDLDRFLGPACYRQRVLLSLAGASYIDSAGVGWLVMCHKAFLQAGGLLVVHSLSPLVAHVFQVLGMGTLMHVAGDEQEARQLARALTPSSGPAPARKAATACTPGSSAAKS